MERPITAGAFLGRVTATGVAASVRKLAEAACDKYVSIMKKESGVNEDNISCEVKRYNPGPSMGVGPTLMKVSLAHMHFGFVVCSSCAAPPLCVWKDEG